MGMQTPQIAQPISQQSPQGKGNSLVEPAAEQVNAALPQPAVMPQDQSQGKGFAQTQPYQLPSQQHFGKGGTTNSATSGQPQMGQPNTYSNTVGPWDNSNNQPQVQSGKGKGH